MQGSAGVEGARGDMSKSTPVKTSTNLPNQTPRTAQPAARTTAQPPTTVTPDQAQPKLPIGATAGQQTRGASGVRLSDQETPAGKELIGMRAGLPIYADKTVATTSTQTSPQFSADPQLAAVQRNMQQLSSKRDQEYLKNPDITGSTRPASTTSFFSKEYAQQFKAAQAAANQRAIDRIGAPRQDKPTSTTSVTNAAAAALRNAAAQPRVATPEQVRAAGFGPRQTERLMFTENVTPEYLERLKKRSLSNY